MKHDTPNGPTAATPPPPPAAAVAAGTVCNDLKQCNSIIYTNFAIYPQTIRKKAATTTTRVAQPMPYPNPAQIGRQQQQAGEAEEKRQQQRQQQQRKIVPDSAASVLRLQATSHCVQLVSVPLYPWHTMMVPRQWGIMHLPTAGGGSPASARMTGGNAGQATETKINCVLEFLFIFWNF